MSRYYLTREAAKRLGCGVQTAWRVLKREGVQPIGFTARDEGGSPVLVWRAVDVEAVRDRRRAMTAQQRRVQAQILAGIARRRAKRCAIT